MPCWFPPGSSRDPSSRRRETGGTGGGRVGVLAMGSAAHPRGCPPQHPAAHRASLPRPRPALSIGIGCHNPVHRPAAQVGLVSVSESGFRVLAGLWGATDAPGPATRRCQLFPRPPEAAQEPLCVPQ